ncbi:hypothetical protein R3P38DRAFT_3089690 [Favolaschia claudopus]|uniref:Uncharacterized protein n=1 Tax=Favolaschia claudopus TaxID=2862362 RepID=A0AAV9ZT16_9AGAR
MTTWVIERRTSLISLLKKHDREGARRDLLSQYIHSSGPAVGRTLSQQMDMELLGSWVSPDDLSNAKQAQGRVLMRNQTRTEGRDAKIIAELAKYLPILEPDDFLPDKPFFHLVLSIAEDYQRHCDGLRNNQIPLELVDGQEFKSKLLGKREFQWIYDEFWISCDEMYGPYFLSDDPAHIDVQEAAAALAAIVANGSGRTPDPFDPLFRDMEACAVVIDRRPDLLALLKVAIKTKDHSAVERYPAVQRTEAKENLRNYLDTLRPLLTSFIERGIPFDTWTPPTSVKCDKHISAHIESLRIPHVSSGNPGLLIHDLGRFSEDVELRSRVDGIFQRTAITFLVNTSGSGKTRLSLEGLCRHWGFYFILAQDTNHLGSSDSGPKVHRDVSPTTGFAWDLPDVDSVEFWPTKNIEIIDEQLSRVLLGRLLVFHLYSEIIASIGITEEHKRQWLLFQLKPELEGHFVSDTFSHLTTYTSLLSKDEVADLIAAMFSKLRRIHGTGFHLFYVIDEAQVASHATSSGFQRDGQEYPVLREIIRVLGAKSRLYESSFVICGTDIPKEGFTNAQFASSVRWTSDTGSFDDEAEHRRYVSRFLVPAYVSSPAGQVFLNRMWKWARGRHRTTDAILRALLLDGCQTPHRLLSDFVEATTRYYPTDYSDPDEPHRYTIPAHVRKLPNGVFIEPDLLCRIQQVLFHYLSSSQTPPPVAADGTGLVSEAIGRFIDRSLSQIVVDEPLSVIRIAQSVCHRYPDPDSDVDSDLDSEVSFSIESWFESSFSLITHHQDDCTPRSLAAFLTYYLARAVELGSPMSTIFSFHHKSIPDWANQTAKLVVPPASQIGSYIPYDGSGSLLTSATTRGDVESWLDGSEEQQTPFCLTHTSDPNLLFTLQLAGGRYLRIILRTVVSETVVNKPLVKNIMRGLEPDQLLLDEETTANQAAVVSKLHAPRETDDPFSVVRVVASFPARTHLNNLPAPPKNSPIANLNTGTFKKLASEIPASEILEQIVKNVTAHASGTRKRPAESFVSEPPPKSPKSPRLAAEPPNSPIPSRARVKRRAG